MATDDFVILRIEGVTPEVLSDPKELQEAVSGLSADQIGVELQNLDTADLPDVLQEPGVAGAAANMPMTLVAPFAAEGDAPEAVGGGATWGLEAVGALGSPRTGRGTTVAVLDTGINREHKAFADIGEIVEKDFTREGDGDDNGHGTHCAGTVCGGSVNGKRIGVAPGVDKLLVGKVLGATGGGTTQGIVDAMIWAAREGANVISMSLGIGFLTRKEREIANGFGEEEATSRTLDAYRQNLRLFDRVASLVGEDGPFARSIVIAASGNDSRRPDFEVGKSPPSAADGIMSVGALRLLPDGKLDVAPFSNTGPAVSAPGFDVESATHDSNDGLRSISGTSMATPHVAGLAALWFEDLTADNPEFRMDELTANLVGRTKKRDVFADGVDANSRGAGLVQAP